MAEYKIDPRKQFSKWLARYGAIIWGIYAFAVLALIAYQPETAMAAVYLTLIMTANKALDTLSYTKNSTTEKMILGLLEKSRMEINIGGRSKGGGNNEESAVTEEGGNG
jgi:hypothetical protein